MGETKRLVLDVLKPYEPSIIEFAEKTEEPDGVEAVNAILLEIDEEVQNIKLTIEGQDIDDEEIRKKVEDLGGSVHSVDEIVVGSKMVEESETPQD